MNLYEDDLFAGPSVPYLKILVQPKQYGYRFRYKSEGLGHGYIPGEGKSTRSAKLLPKIQMCNLNGKKAKVVMHLVPKPNDMTMHINSIVISKEETSGIHMVTLSDNENSYDLKRTSILQATEKDENVILTYMERVYQTQRLQDDQIVDADTFVAQLKGFHCVTNPHIFEESAKNLREKLKSELHTSCIAFHVFVEDDDGNFTNRQPVVFSDIFFDGKSKLGCCYAILRMSKICGSMEGGDEIWMLCDKFNPNDLEIRFYSDGLVIPWEGFGIFSPSDVFCQKLVIFRTPPFLSPKHPVDVNVKLQIRTKNKLRCSTPKDFTYKSVSDEYAIGRKRKKFNDMVTNLYFESFDNVPNENQASDNGTVDLIDANLHEDFSFDQQFIEALLVDDANIDCLPQTENSGELANLNPTNPGSLVDGGSGEPVPANLGDLTKATLEGVASEPTSLTFPQ